MTTLRGAGLDFSLRVALRAALVTFVLKAPNRCTRLAPIAGLVVFVLAVEDTKRTPARLTAFKVLVKKALIFIAFAFSVG